MTVRPLWTLGEIVDATGARLSGPAAARDAEITGVSIDSRTISRGDLFVAIRGDRLDGHDYAIGALEKGAGGALVEVGALGIAAETSPGPLLEVADALKGLEDLGRAARSRVSGAVVAVTGSVGKTGTKEMLRTCLAPEGPTHAAVNSFNNHWGVPLTLARMPRETQYGVFEIGMNHAGEITPLTGMVRPDVAIVTTVEAVHLENFPSVEAIADAKAEIFSGLVPSGTAIINRDNIHFARLRDAAVAVGARVVGFGEHPDADVRLEAVTLAADGSAFRVVIGRRSLELRIGAAGRHLVQNALAVLAACDAAGVDPARAGARLELVEAPKGRGARLRLKTPDGPILVIDESYNANPASMRAALAAVGQIPRAEFPRRVAVLGDMLELGPTREALHAGLVDAITSTGIDRVHLVGPLMAGLHAALPVKVRGLHVQRSEDLSAGLVAECRPGDVIMFKGSLGSRIGPLVEALVSAYPKSAPLSAATNATTGRATARGNV